MTKPPGSLGVLEDVAAQLAGIAGSCPAPLPIPATVAVFAADHGVHAQGVTPWPQEVTAQMVANFLAGGAVVNAFAAEVGAEVVVVDVGVAGHLAPDPALMDRKVRRGTADLAEGPAMTLDEALRAVEVGIEVATRLAPGSGSLVTGDMGIANTTASAALVCAFTGAAPGDGHRPRHRRRRPHLGAQGRRRHAGDRTGAAAAHDPGGGAGRARRGRRARARGPGRVHHRRGRAPDPGAPRRRHRRVRRPRGGGAVPGRAGLRAGGARVARGGACARAARTSGCARCWAWTCVSARAPARSWRVPLVTSAARALRDVATFDSAGVTGKGS